MGVLVPGGDRTAVKRTADFFLAQFTQRLEAQVGGWLACWRCLVGAGWLGGLEVKVEAREVGVCSYQSADCC